MLPAQLPTCEPQKARFWKSQGKLLKSSPSPKRPNFTSSAPSKYCCLSHSWVSRQVCPRPQTSCTELMCPARGSPMRSLERFLPLRSVTVNWNSAAFQPRIFSRSMCTPRANWSV